MKPLRQDKPALARVLRLLATAVAGLVALLVINTVMSDSQDPNAIGLSTSSVFTVPGGAEPQATAVPTTPPLAIPTATATAVPTVAPTATAEATPTAAPEPTSTDSGQRGVRTGAAEVSVADAGATAASPDATDPPAEPPPPAVPEPAPEPTATAVPEPTPIPTLPPPTPTIAPLPDPTPTFVPLPEPTATLEPAPVSVSSVADLEFYVLGEINQVRASAGLGPLALDPTISSLSRDWSQQMASGGFFAHRPSHELSALLPPGWRRWGENIASAPDILWAQSSLEASPGHYENMVGPFTHVGIGVYEAGGQVWVTQNFVAY